MHPLAFLIPGVLSRSEGQRMDIQEATALWIVIPAFNEAETIGEVVARCRAHYPRVVVVDDCSIDETRSKAADHGAIVIRHPINLGQGAALQTGISYALAHGAGQIVTFDADGQHRVADIEVLVRRQHSSGADVVLGSRFLGSAENMPRLRRAVLRAAVLFTRITSGLNLTDAHNGLRLLTRAAAQRVRILQNRMAHASELLDQFAESGLKVVEAPVTIVYSEYSLRKGQKLGNAFNVLAELLTARLSR
jgi:polyprenyl-phospho-N-acetylgalactosaminyl synthase